MPTGGLASWLVPLLWNTAASYAMNMVTNKLFGPKGPDKKINELQTQCNSSLSIPTVYGKRKAAGNIIWQQGEGKTVPRIVSFCEGKIKGISQILFNDLLVTEGPVAKIKNTLYPDATISIVAGGGATQNDKTLSLYANGQTTNIILCAPMDVGKNGMKDHNGTVKYLLSYIADLGNGWEVVDPVPSSNQAESVHAIEPTSCYNNPIGLVVNGLSGCSYTTYLGDGVQQLDSRIAGDTLEEKAKTVGGLKYEAYVAVTAKASDQLSGNYNVTAIIEGKEVRIYDTATSYHTAWSDNPAWCILDFLMGYNGCGLTEDEIDIPSFIEAAAYCDELVNGQKRFTLNMILNEKKTRQDWLQEMFITCRAYPTYQRGKHGILIEKPEPVSQVFNVQKTEELEFWWSETNEEIDRLNIKYIDPAYEWTQVTAVAEVASTHRRIIEKTIDIDGITNFPQASRQAWFYSNQSQTCKQWARYKCNKRAMNRSIGEVIELNDPIMQLQGKKWRIMAMTEPQGNSIEMIMREYNEALYTDKMGSVKPVVNRTTLSNPLNTPDVSNITLDEDTYILKDGTALTDIIINFTAPDWYHLGYFDIYYSVNNGTERYYGVANESGFKIKALQNTQSIKVRVVTVAKGGMSRSDGVYSATYYITGKSEPPPDITSFSVGQLKDKLYFSAVKPNIPDLKYIEFREGENWELSTLVGRDPEGVFETSQFTAGTKSYWVKAVDRSNNYSRYAKRFVITITEAPERNVILGMSKLIEKSLPTGYMDDPGYMDDDGYMDTPTDFDEYFYIDQPIDLGEIASVNLLMSYDATVSGNTRITLEMCTSLDGENYSEWQQYAPGSFTAEFINQRIRVESLDQMNNVYVRSISTSVDVPDRKEKVTKSIDVAGWTDFTFEKPFHNAPVMSVFAQTVDTIPYVDPTLITKTGFKAIIKDLNTGQPVVGSFLYEAEGF